MDLVRTIPDRLLLPLRFDAAALAADIAALSRADWVRHFVKQNYDGDWDVVPLRAKAGATHPIMMIVSDPGTSEYTDTPLLHACPAIGAALAALACPLLAVRLMRLGPGSVIREHVDPDLDAEQGTVRLHVPLVTNPEVDVRLNGRQVFMEAGSLWYLRLSDPHSVANRGDTERIHLVIDATVNPWLATLLTDAAAAAA